MGDDNLGDNDLSPTEKAPGRSVANEFVASGNDLADLREKEGTIRVLRERVASQNQHVKKLEERINNMESRCTTRGILLGRAMAYLQPGRDALKEDTPLRVEVSRLIEEIIRELDKDAMIPQDRKLTPEQAEKFVELACRKDILSENIRRSCLRCGAEIPEDSESCPQCYDRDDAARALAIGKDAHAKLDDLAERAKQVVILQEDNEALREQIISLREQIVSLQQTRENDQSISEVRVAGRMLERLNGMVTTLDSLIKDAEHTAATLAEEKETVKQDRIMIEKAVANHVKDQMAKALAPYLRKE